MSNSEVITDDRLINLLSSIFKILDNQKKNSLSKFNLFIVGINEEIRDIIQQIFKDIQRDSNS